jgi:hypothetical protein
MASDGKRMLHNVFFTLKDPSAAKQQKLVEDCYTYLSAAAGAMSFAAGLRDAGYTRDSNDKSFHVALTVLFESAAAHDAYQVWQRHKDFIAANQDNWQQVRVFDSAVQ